MPAVGAQLINSADLATAWTTGPIASLDGRQQVMLDDSD